MQVFLCTMHLPCFPDSLYISRNDCSHFCKCGTSVLWTNSRSLLLSTDIWARIFWAEVIFYGGCPRMKSPEKYLGVCLGGGDFWDETVTFNRDIWGNCPGWVFASTCGITSVHPAVMISVQSPWFTHRHTRRQVSTLCIISLTRWVKNFLALLLMCVCVAEIRAYFDY